MAKRKLTKHQSRRIKQNQKQSAHRAKAEPIDYDDDALGPEQEARIIAHYGKQVDIETDAGQHVRCFLRANLDSVVTGDYVVWREFDDLGVVVSVAPRSSYLCRPDSYGKLKPVAANIDQIIITVAPEPEVHTNLIDRYIVAAESHNISAKILINKSDLMEGNRLAKFAAIRLLYQELGYTVILASAKIDKGLDELQQNLKDKTSIFVGQSGVGKSSIIQRLLPNESIEVGALSSASAKGRHTTTHSQLFHFPDGGECIDSPGIREFGLWHLSANDVIAGFKEIYVLAQSCKFRDCSHAMEPGCHVQKALKKKELSAQRFESFKRILSSLDDVDCSPRDTKK